MSRRLSFLAGLFFLLFPLSTAQARIWAVNAEGTGEAPTIQAAIDSLTWSGDIIELIDGVYTGDGNRDLYNMGKDFLIRSKSGNPANCVLDLEGTEDEWHWGIAFAEDG